MSEENLPRDSGSLRDRMLKRPDSSLDSDNFKDQVFFSERTAKSLFPRHLSEQ